LQLDIAQITGISGALVIFLKPPCVFELHEGFARLSPLTFDVKGQRSCCHDDKHRLAADQGKHHAAEGLRHDARRHVCESIRKVTGQQPLDDALSTDLVQNTGNKIPCRCGRKSKPYQEAALSSEGRKQGDYQSLVLLRLRSVDRKG